MFNAAKVNECMSAFSDSFADPGFGKFLPHLIQAKVYIL